MRPARVACLRCRAPAVRAARSCSPAISGINRVAAGRLYHIARALGVEVGYFFEGLGRDNALKVTPQQRLLLELGSNFIAIPIRKHQEAICSLARTLAERDAGH